jgi:leucyl aminopeptidase
VIVVGLGPRDAFTAERARQAAGAAIRRARDLGGTHVATVLHGAGQGHLDVPVAAQALAEGTLLALYRFTELKKADPNRHEIERAMQQFPGTRRQGRVLLHEQFAQFDIARGFSKDGLATVSGHGGHG